MQLSEGVEWGIHCALLLADCQGSETIPGKAWQLTAYQKVVW